MKSALAEAAVCFTNGCFVAAAIMIRKMLEEVCHDQQATGSKLKKRVKALGQSVLIPPPLLAGLDNLRLLGNDAAHIESQTFNEVGEREVQISFDVVKEFLKGVYQYGALIAALDELKRENDAAAGNAT